MKDWRADPDQPPLTPLDPLLESHLGVYERQAGTYEYGGVLRKP